jgi:hypothetical protein
MMLVSLVPGASSENALRVLRNVESKLSTIRSGHGKGSFAWLLSYLSWANDSVRVLRSQVRSDDIRLLVLTKGYDSLLAMVGHGYREMAVQGGKIVIQPQPGVEDPPLNDLLGLEIEERAAVFSEVVTALDAQIRRWSRPGSFVVLDTSVYINHPDKLKGMDIATLVGAREDINLLVPIVVVDELDGLKQNNNKHVRWRAGHAIGLLNAILSNPPTGILRAADLSGLKSGELFRGEIRVELILDSPGHIRLPINDDEIIDRALAAQVLIGQPVTLVTYDGGQALRARSAGLREVRLQTSVEQEPEPEPPAKKS